MSKMMTRQELTEMIKKQQEEFRNDHRKLAKAIADQIRAENIDLNNIDNEISIEDITDDSMHWQQGAWGEIKVDETTIEENMEEPKEGLFTFTCGTTGCIAGYATTFAGFPMAIHKRYYTKQDLLDMYDGESINLDDCFDKENNELIPIGTTAARLLRLSVSKQGWLFNGSRTKEEVLWALDTIARDGSFTIDEAWAAFPETYDND